MRFISKEYYLMEVIFNNLGSVILQVSSKKVISF